MVHPQKVETKKIELQNLDDEIKATVSESMQSTKDIAQEIGNKVKDDDCVR